MHVIGLDIGATKVNALLVDAAGAVLDRHWRARDTGTGDDAFACARRILTELMASAGSRGQPVSAIGVAVAGLVDARAGVLVDGGLLMVRDRSLGRELEAELGAPVVLENDANATLIAALADHEPSGPDATSVLFALGTGVGGAVALGRRVVRGSFGLGGELGHLPVDPAGGQRCVCGSTGCLELVSSGSGIARQAREAARAGEADGLVIMSRTAPSELTAIDVVRSARAGQPCSIALLASAGDALGRAIAGLGAALDPEVIFISGSLGHAAADLIIPAMRRRLGMQHAYPEARPLPEIRCDPHGPDAAAIGAALLARTAVEGGLA